MNKPNPISRRVIARPKDYEPTTNEMRVIGTFNPGATIIDTPEGPRTLLLVRIAETPRQNLETKTLHVPRRGLRKVPTNQDVCLPFYHIQNRDSSTPEIGFDIIPRWEIEWEGEKEVKLKDGLVRLKHISLPRQMLLDCNENILKKDQNPAITPDWEPERFGIEDPRITPLEGSYAITYVCPHRTEGVSTLLTTTKDFSEFKRFPPKNTPRPIIPGVKDVVIFPEKLRCPCGYEKGGEVYCGIFRPDSSRDTSNPGMWVIYSQDLCKWGHAHRITITPKRIITGTGSPPIKIGNYWHMAYHETNHTQKGAEYKTKILRVNKDHPWEGSISSPILLTREDYRKILPEDGYVPNVVFTSGMVEKNGTTTLFSGIDDTWTVADTFYTEDLVKFTNQN